MEGKSGQIRSAKAVLANYIKTICMFHTTQSSLEGCHWHNIVAHFYVSHVSIKSTTLPEYI